MIGKSFRLKTLRLYPREDSIIDRACAALNGMERSQLVQEAALVEAGRLGIRWSVGTPRPLASSWPYMPERGEEPTGVRVSITVSLSSAELITRAAEYVHASEPLFLIGATLAHIGRLQKCLRVIHADTPEEAREIRAKLERIKLPAQYQYPRPSK